MSSRTKTNVVSEQIRTKAQHKLLSLREQVIIIARTRYYYSKNQLIIIIVGTSLYVISNKQNKVSEQMITTIRKDLIISGTNLS
jgi:hypothetical protein